MHFRAVILSLFVVSDGLVASSTSNSVVETPLGKIQGWERISRDGRVYEAWTRIPYAQPPVGKLRLVAPKPITKWNGILNATGEMPQCIQDGGGQEDCLYLNVFRPKIQWRKLAVLVYVHGGGFQTGNGAAPENADYIMDEDVVLVCIHYRLNGFGFMALGDEVMPGNFGLKDQALALKWVNENIAAFGGDPDSVTVFGVSAGGASAHYLLKSPASEAYVTRAVSDSGTINHIWAQTRSDILVTKTLGLVRDLNCTGSTSQEILECLQSVQDSKLLQAIWKHNDKDPARITFVPTIEPSGTEGAFATEDLSLRPSNKPWITSITNGEYLLLVKALATVQQSYYDDISQNSFEYVEKLVKVHVSDPEDVKRGTEILHDYYFNPENSDGNFSLQYSQMNAGAFFLYPVFFNIIKHQGPKWIYHFEYKGQYSGYDWKTGKSTTPDGVCGHAEEWLFYFNAQATRMNEADYRVSKRLIKYLVNFAYYSDPTPSMSGENWTQYNNDDIFRVTGTGDFLGGSSFCEQLKIPFNVWETAIGWNK